MLHSMHTHHPRHHRRSGAIYAVRLLEVLRAAGRDVHLSISPSGRDVIRHELKLDIDLDNFDAKPLAA